MEKQGLIVESSRSREDFIGIDECIKTLQKDAQVLFTSKEELGLYLKIVQGLKVSLLIKDKGTFTDEKNFKDQLHSFIDQSTAFLHFLKSGNEDYGKSQRLLEKKYNITPADFNHSLAAYNNVVRHLKDEREKQLSRALMFDCLFKQSLIFIDEVL